MIEINPGGVVKEVKVANYTLFNPRGKMKSKKRTDETATGDSRKYYDGPSPASDVVQAVNLRVLSVSSEWTICCKSLPEGRHPSTFESHRW